MVPIPAGISYMDVVKASLAGWRDAASINGTFIVDNNWPYPNDRAKSWAAVAKEVLQVLSNVGNTLLMLLLKIYMSQWVKD